MVNGICVQFYDGNVLTCEYKQQKKYLSYWTTVHAIDFNGNTVQKLKIEASSIKELWKSCYAYTRALMRNQNAQKVSFRIRQIDATFFHYSRWTVTRPMTEKVVSDLFSNI